MAGLVETDVKTAAMHLQARYSSLSVYAKQIMALRQKIGKPLNCSIIDDYHRAVNDYLNFGNSFFAQMNAKGMRVQQVVYKNGKIVDDPNNPGHALTVTLDKPLRPPTFTLSPNFCPTVTKVSPPPPSTSHGDTEVGIAPLVLAVYIVGAIVFVGVAGYVTIKILEQIKIIVHGPDYDPDKRVDASLKCIDNLIAKGIKADKASETCMVASAPPPPTAFSQWTGPIIFGAVALGGALLILGKKGGGGGSVPATS
jgi:hypothetical protein